MTGKGRRPLALIDVDGVLNPYAAQGCPPGYTEREFAGHGPVRFRPDHGHLLRRLVPRFELVWATRWQHAANDVFGPLLGLPPLPVIEFPAGEGDHADKFPTIAHAVGDRAAAWIDDLHSDAARRWAARRRPPTLLIHADPAVGLTADAIARFLRFAGQSVAGDRSPFPRTPPSEPGGAFWGSGWPVGS
jgi:hypothetical protein